MKKFTYLLLSLFGLFFFPLIASAASGKITVSGPSQAVVGNTITVTVTLSSSSSIGSWEMDLDYNKSYLQLTSSGGEAGGTGMVNYASSNAGVKSKKYTFKFKVLKTGSTTISVPSYDVYAADMSSMSITSSGRTIKLITQQELEASYSKNNDLGSLSVEGFELNPAFNKSTLEYSITVPEDTKSINILAKASDSKASVSGTGTKEVNSGNNTFNIVVRAENGNEKTYVLNVNVIDASPINVTVENKNYTVVKIRENLPTPTYYEEYTVKINDFDIPAFRNDNTKIVLIGLKNEAGDVTLFIYDEQKKEYLPYEEIGLNKLTISPLAMTESLKGYEKGKIVINNREVPAYYIQKNSRFVIIYGINIETGEKGFYEYDTKNQTVMKYNSEMIDLLETKNTLYTYIIIGFLGLFILMLILLVTLIRKNQKRKKNSLKEKKAAKNDAATEKIKKEMKEKKNSKDSQ